MRDLKAWNRSEERVYICLVTRPAGQIPSRLELSGHRPRGNGAVEPLEGVAGLTRDNDPKVTNAVLAYLDTGARSGLGISARDEGAFAARRGSK